jgi:hypothetical protein
VSAVQQQPGSIGRPGPRGPISLFPRVLKRIEPYQDVTRQRKHVLRHRNLKCRRKSRWAGSLGRVFKIVLKFEKSSAARFHCHNHSSTEPDNFIPPTGLVTGGLRNFGKFQSKYTRFWLDPDSEFACRSAFAVKFLFRSVSPHARQSLKFPGEIYHQYLHFGRASLILRRTCDLSPCFH